MRTLQNLLKTYESQDSKEGTIDEMPYNGKRDTCRSHLHQKARASREEWGCYPTVKTLTHNCSCLKELQGWKLRQS